VDASLVDVISCDQRRLQQFITESHPTMTGIAGQIDVDDGEISRILLP